MTTISIITPTFRREDLLQRCVESVLAQEVDARVEHFVVNDAGEPLRPAAWMDDPRVTVLNTHRTDKCVARNTGAALSTGDWLCFLDDDDYMLPGAFAATLAAAQEGEPVLVYGGNRAENEKTGESSVVQPTVSGDAFPRTFCGETFPQQTSWLRRGAFYQAGCYDPLFVAAEEVDLFRRVTFLGPVAGTTHVCAVVRVEHGSTLSQWSRHLEFGLKSNEKMQQMPETLPRLVAATVDQPYWRGRCAREYLGTAYKHLKAGRRLLAVTRLAAAARLARGRGKDAEFRRGLRRR